MAVQSAAYLQGGPQRLLGRHEEEGFATLVRNLLHGRCAWRPAWLLVIVVRGTEEPHTSQVRGHAVEDTHGVAVTGLSRGVAPGVALRDR